MGHLQCTINLAQHKNLQVNKMTRFRGTSLHLSCERNYIEIVKVLLAKDAYISLKDPNEQTPFDLTSNREILNLLAISTGEQELKKYSDCEPTPFISEV